MKLSALLLASSLSMNPVSIGTVAVTFVGVDMAMACVAGDVNCNQPTAVGKGKKAPTWEVVGCVIGPAGGPYVRIDCDDPDAVHKSPKGMDAVCFLGSDGKIHWDIPGIVYEGRPFKNLRVGSEWQPLWTLTAAEKARLGIN